MQRGGPMAPRHGSGAPARCTSGAARCRRACHGSHPAHSAAARPPPQCARCAPPEMPPRRRARSTPPHGMGRAGQVGTSANSRLRPLVDRGPHKGAEGGGSTGGMGCNPGLPWHVPHACQGEGQRRKGQARGARPMERAAAVARLDGVRVHAAALHLAAHQPTCGVRRRVERRRLSGGDAATQGAPEKRGGACYGDR